MLECLDEICWVRMEEVRWAERVLGRWSYNQSWRPWEQQKAGPSIMIHVKSSGHGTKVLGQNINVFGSAHQP